MGVLAAVSARNFAMGLNRYNVPKWVKSWLENYIERKRFESVKKTLKESGACE